MQKFKFPLERVLAWRKLEARLAENELQRLNAELAKLAADASRVAAEREQAALELVTGRGATGEALSYLGSYERAADSRIGRLKLQRTVLQGKVESQLKIVSTRARAVRLLEKLKEQRMKSWQFESNREIEQLAAEAHLFALRNKRNS
jgi:flagellar export protein FliJ